MAETRAPQRLSLKRWLPLLVLAAGLALFFGLGLNRHLSLDALAANRQRLAGWVNAHHLLAAPAYIAVYALVVAFSLPGGAIMTMTGGLLFGWVFGTFWAVIGATLGATLLFLAARTALGDALRARAGPWMQRLEAGFRENAFSYLLALRLVPVIPFFILNLVPAFLGVTLSTFVLTTLIGIIPGAAVYAGLGNSLNAIFDAGGTPDLRIIFKPEILLPILGLIVLSLVPVAYKRWKGRQP
jgi:uncharacterized membrane protein YdjX (TVP38/TMEM64 family)